MGRPQASWLRQVESYLKNTGLAGLAPAWAMARRRPKGYRRKVDAAMHCSDVCLHSNDFSIFLSTTHKFTSPKHFKIQFICSMDMSTLQTTEHYFIVYHSLEAYMRANPARAFAYFRQVYLACNRTRWITSYTFLRSQKYLPRFTFAIGATC